MVTWGVVVVLLITITIIRANYEVRNTISKNHSFYLAMLTSIAMCILIAKLILELVNFK